MRLISALLLLAFGSAGSNEFCLTESENGLNHTWDCTFGFSYHKWVGFREEGGYAGSSYS